MSVLENYLILQADRFKALFALFTVASFMFTAAFMATSAWEQKSYKKQTIISFVLFMVFLLITVATPSTKNLILIKNGQLEEKQ